MGYLCDNTNYVAVFILVNSRECRGQARSLLTEIKRHFATFSMVERDRKFYFTIPIINLKLLCVSAVTLRAVLDMMWIHSVKLNYTSYCSNDPRKHLSRNGYVSIRPISAEELPEQTPYRRDMSLG